MPVFTAIGLALGASAGAAAAVGAGATALAGFGAYKLGSSQAKGIGDIDISDTRVSSPGTGKLSETEAQTLAKKRAFRSGVLFTSPTGLNSVPSTSSAKLR